MSQLYQKILVPSYCVHSEGASHEVFENIPKAIQLPKPSPIIFLKAVKNEQEIRWMQEASIKDAAALCDCYAYLEKCVCENNWIKNNIQNFNPNENLHLLTYPNLEYQKNASTCQF